MKWLVLILAVTVVEYTAAPLVSEWDLAVFCGALRIALAVQCILGEIKQKPLMFRSVVAVFCVTAWLDVADYALWWWSGREIDIALPLLVGFTCWLIVAVKREYEYQGDEIKPGPVYLLFLRPRTNWELLKSFLGLPVSSVCLYANGEAWAFRGKSGRFERLPAAAWWLQKHIAIDTGQQMGAVIETALAGIVGERRFPWVKCVWSIRRVLAHLGDNFKPRFFDYLPGIYAMRIIKGRA